MKTSKKHETVTATLNGRLRAAVRRVAVKALTRIIAIRYDKTLRRLANS